MITTEPTREFVEYVAGQRTALLRFAVVLTGDLHRAEDIVADVLGRAYEKWDVIRDTSYPHAYVRRMVVNHFISSRRKLSRVRIEGDPAALDTAIPDPAPAHAERDAVLARLATLPTRQRAVLVLHFYEGLSTLEIAAELHCREGTVRSHLSRGLASLRIQYDADRAVQTKRGTHDG